MSVTMLFLCVAVLTPAVGIFIFRAIPGIRAYFDFRGKRLVTCPETQKTEAVDVAAGQAAAGAFLWESKLRLNQCSRWPEREHCGQECLSQIEADPENCLVWNIVSRWYEDKHCVYCRKLIGALHHLDHAPALLTPDYRTIEWSEVRPQDLPMVFATHRPVCWNCHIAENFRRVHPELVVDREMEIKRTR